MADKDYPKDKYHDPVIIKLRKNPRAEELFHDFLRNRKSIKIFYRVWGLSDPNLTVQTDYLKRIILNVHGVSSHSEMSITLADHLLDKSTIVVGFDLPGHGHSQGTRGDYVRFMGFIETLEDIITYFAEEYPQKQLILSGESMGALVVILYILKIYNHRSEVYKKFTNITKLLFWSPAFAPNFKTGWSKNLEYILKLGLNFIIKKDSVSIDVDHRKTFQNKVALSVHNIHPFVLKKYSARYLTSINIAMKKLNQYGFSNYLTIPFCIIHGTHDYLVSQSQSYKFYKTSPLSKSKQKKKYIKVPHAWHHLFTDPFFTDAYWKEIKKWIDR